MGFLYGEIRGTDREMIQPFEVMAWVNISKGIEESIDFSSWANETEAKACARIYHQLNYVLSKSLLLLSLGILLKSNL
jgi:hypothetical protein